jgi:hypothetical protein
LYFTADVRQRSEMLREYDSDHFGILSRLLMSNVSRLLE